jgi:hypothetical protein
MGLWKTLFGRREIVLDTPSRPAYLAGRAALAAAGISVLERGTYEHGLPVGG